MSPIVQATNLYRFFHTGDEEVFALRGVSITVNEGELVAIVGPSGSGKSTLFACLVGLDVPDGGKVKIAGSAMTRGSESERAALRRQTIGIMLQQGNLFSHLSVLENVRMRRSISTGHGNGNDDEILTRLGLAGRRHALPETLSGGEAARAGLAVALTGKPKVLVCDEPTAEVDATTEAVIAELLHEERRRGAAILVATHSDALATGADRVLRIADGVLQ